MDLEGIQLRNNILFYDHGNITSATTFPPSPGVEFISSTMLFLYGLMSMINGPFPVYGIHWNTVSLPASLRFLPTTGSNFTQFRKLVPKYRDSNMRIALRDVYSRRAGTQKCSKARLAKSSSCSYSNTTGSMYVWATGRKNLTSSPITCSLKW